MVVKSMYPTTTAVSMFTNWHNRGWRVDGDVICHQCGQYPLLT
jgi:hypothetical protein